MKNRKQKVARNSGGIAVLVKYNTLNNVSATDNNCEYFQWFKMFRSFCNTYEPHDHDMTKPTKLVCVQRRLRSDQSPRCALSG